MSETYHLRINKSYAVAVIEDLQRMGAVELFNDNINPPDWHKPIVEKRMAEYDADKTIGINFDAAMDDIEKTL